MAKAKAGKVVDMPRSPRSQALPGHEQVRDKVLDGICEEVADIRATINDCKTKERGYRSKALDRMTKKSLTQYETAGVKLTIEEGAVKLNIKLTGGDGTRSIGGDAEGEDSATDESGDAGDE